ncbi:MauE/DoxX family redox-associated membrane protein [Actinomadura physcomitrii]|uniref:MauE/DoxX family redox-associated membrane protein n=1 Tax=Actinomadura physcomitrii TaxID=2650748 RepID=UPI001923C5F1|nr:MauE/DoxX family redox-associated membrane protein [Actinomadura physcomitrii]
MTVLASAWPALIAVLLVAAGGKVRDVRGFAAAIGAYRVLPQRLTGAAAVAVLSAEAAAAGLLAVPATRRWGALAAAALFAAFLGAMASVLRRGMEIDCGCFGSARRPTPVGAASMARTGLLLVLAVMAAVAGPAPFSPLQPVLAAVLLGAVAVVPRPRLGLAEPEAPPPAGPRPGTRFALNFPIDAPTVFALVSPSCGLCLTMLPVFAEAASGRRVVLVSAADEDGVRRHLDEEGIALPLVTDPDVYDANGIPWPPYAVVTDAAGTVLAAGGADTPRRFHALLHRAESAGARRPG